MEITPAPSHPWPTTPGQISVAREAAHTLARHFGKRVTTKGVGRTVFIVRLAAASTPIHCSVSHEEVVFAAEDKKLKCGPLTFCFAWHATFYPPLKEIGKLQGVPIFARPAEKDATLALLAGPLGDELAAFPPSECAFVQSSGAQMYAKFLITPPVCAHVERALRIFDWGEDCHFPIADHSGFGLGRRWGSALKAS